MAQIEFKAGDVWLSRHNEELEIVKVNNKAKYIRYKRFSKSGDRDAHWTKAEGFNEQVIFKVGTVKAHKGWFKTTYSIDYV